MRKATTFAIIVVLTLSMLFGQLVFFSDSTISAKVINGGHITTNTTWDLANSPYFIEGDVYVDNNVSLTIEPGVEVRFNGSYGLFVTNGSLIAVGNPLSMINFTSNGTFYWNRIQINSTGYAEIRFCNITSADFGIFISLSSNNLIQNSIILDSFNWGIFISESSGNDIRNNTISNTIFGHGIHLYKSQDNNIINNSIFNNYRGLYLYESTYNNIDLNRIFSNHEGIRVTINSNENNITMNNISQNTNGVNLTSSSSNNIYHNIFWNNTNQADDSEINNLWDDGYPNGGNYWSDFDEPSEGAYDNSTGTNQDEPGSDGIIDDPYLDIGGGGGAVDNYPLLRPLVTRIFVYLDSPRNNSVILPNTTLYFTVVGDNIVMVNYSLNGGVTNFTLSSPWNISTSGWPDEQYIIDIFVHDSEDNITKFWFNITIDSVKPEIILNSPQNGSLILPGVMINLTVLDNNLASVSYSLNGVGNTPLFEPYDIDTTTWEDGNNTIQIYAADMVNNLNMATYNFTIDGSGPSINLLDPGNNSVIKTGTLLNFNISDPHINTTAINYSINGEGPFSFLVEFILGTLSWTDGNYIIEVNATDILGNLRTSIFNITIDSIPPTINLISPLNNSIFTVGEILDFEIMDDHLDFVNYTINFGPNENLTFPHDLDTTFWADGPYRIDIYAVDQAGNINTSFYNFTIETIPRIILNSPSNNSIINAGEIIDLTIEDNNFDYANYSINAGTIQPLGSPFNIGTSAWPDGFYVIEVHVKDKANNTNCSWYAFTIDSTSPIIVLNSHLNNSIISPGSILDFDISDPHLIFTNYSIDGGPFIPFTSPYNINTSGWGDGAHSIAIQAVDITCNENISEFTFTIDSTPPIIQLLSPPNGTTNEVGIPINLSIIENNLDFVNYSVNFGMNHTLPFPFSIDTTDFPDGNCIVIVYAVDLAGNINTSWFEFSFYDITAPTITLNFPENQSFIQRGTIIDLYIFDLFLRNVSYSLDDGGYVALTPPFNITTNTSDWSEGTHVLQVFADDTRNNTNTSLFIFTIDSIIPSIILVSPLNNSAILSGEVLDFNIIEDNLNNLSYSINGGVLHVLSSPFDINTVDWQDGSYAIVFRAEDKAGNENNAMFILIIDSTSPSITLNSPTNGSIIPSGTIINITVLDANIDFVEYSLNEGAKTTFPYPYNFNTTGWDDGNYNFNIHATDRAGNDMYASFNIILDSTAPEVTYISVTAPFYPYDHTSIIIYFNEPMNIESVDSALNITSNLSYIKEWYDNGKTLMLVNIIGIQYKEYYTIRFEEGAQDLAGNPLINVSGYEFIATIDINLDTDEDGMPDGWEFYYDLDPKDPSDADEDKDGDGYTNFEEFEGGSDPTDPEKIPLKSKEDFSTMEYWWLIPILIALLIITIVLFILLIGGRKEESKEPMEEWEDMYLATRAEKDIEAMESIVRDKENMDERINEAEIILEKAKEAFEKHNYNLVTVYEKTLRDLVGEDIEEGEADEAEMEDEISNEE